MGQLSEGTVSFVLSDIWVMWAQTKHVDSWQRTGGADLIGLKHFCLSPSISGDKYHSSDFLNSRQERGSQPARSSGAGGGCGQLGTRGQNKGRGCILGHKLTGLLQMMRRHSSESTRLADACLFQSCLLTTGSALMQKGPTSALQQDYVDSHLTANKSLLFSSRDLSSLV